MTMTSSAGGANISVSIRTNPWSEPPEPEVARPAGPQITRPPAAEHRTAEAVIS